MTKEEVIEKINAVLADEFEVEESVISPEAPLMKTLDLDSLDLVDVVVLVEQNFGIRLKNSDFVGITTFQEFYDLLNSKLAD
ncbi:MAG: phosphopantetheine-binding protein [Paludibacteraceae bacterium]|nr:phosphopantetheine-binding protein [Paludibacteraceae bacterium]